MSSSWMETDASGQSLGRLATKIAGLLIGKDEITYAPHRDNGRHVVVVNCSALKISERRGAESAYRHSGYIGNLKETKKRLIAPTVLMSEAVRGMLPKNKLGTTMLRRLHCFAGKKHPYEGQIHE